MSESHFEADRKNSVSIEALPRSEEQPADLGALSVDELDEVNGGLLPLLMAGAFLAGYGAMAFYHDRRGR